MKNETLTRDYSVTEVCSILGVTPPTVYKLLNRGTLTGYKVGAHRRITNESVDLLRSGNMKEAS